MTFREFCDWCNVRACDGFWSSGTAIVCCRLVVHIRKKPFWKREKVWRKVNADLKVEEKYVKPTDAKIKELANGR